MNNQHLSFIATIALVVLIASSGADLFWLLSAPGQRSVIKKENKPVGDVQNNLSVTPFLLGKAEEASASVPNILRDLILSGLFAKSSIPMAIFRINNKDVPIKTGDVIVEGVILKEVLPDRVIITSGSESTDLLLKRNHPDVSLSNPDLDDL